MQCSCYFQKGLVRNLQGSNQMRKYCSRGNLSTSQFDDFFSVNTITRHPSPMYRGKYYYICPCQPRYSPPGLFSSPMQYAQSWPHRPQRSWTSCQICKIARCACAGNAGNISPPRTSKETAGSDTSMHHGTCLTHVP